MRTDPREACGARKGFGPILAGAQKWVTSGFPGGRARVSDSEVDTRVDHISGRLRCPSSCSRVRPDAAERGEHVACLRLGGPVVASCTALSYECAADHAPKRTGALSSCRVEERLCRGVEVAVSATSPAHTCPLCEHSAHFVQELAILGQGKDRGTDAWRAVVGNWTGRFGDP